MSRSEKFARHSEPGAPNFAYPPQNVEAVASKRAGLLFNLAHARQKRCRRARDMHRIVVVGGGVAGIVTATHLSRRLTRSKSADVLLVDHNLAHVWKPMLHTFAAGTANYTNENISFISHAKLNGFKYWPGELRGLDRRGKVVDLGPVALPDPGETLTGRSI